MNYYVIFLGVIVLILLYFLYTNYISKSTVLTPLIKLDKKTVDISKSDLVRSDSVRYNYSLWVYINSWSSNNEKILLSRGKKTETQNNIDFKLYLDKTTPSLICNFKNNDNSQMTEASKIEITNNFPIQKWTHIIVSVDNKIIDLYLDGKLVLSKKIDFMPKTSEQDVTLGDGNTNDTYLANVIRNPQPMDPQTAWNTYLNGNGQNNSSNLNIKLSVLQDNVEQKRLTLF